MSHTGDAADQVVQMAATLTTEAAKTAADISVKSLTQILTLLIANGKNTSERKKNIIRDIISKPHDVFLVPKDRVKEFAKRCKEYNIPFFVVKRTKPNSEPFVDVIVREMDRGAVNRIAEQMGITLTFVEQTRQGMDNLRSRADGAEVSMENAGQVEAAYSVSDDTLSKMLSEDDAGRSNPMAAQAEIFSPSAPSYENSLNLERDSNTPDFRPVSVRAAIRAMREQRAWLPADREPVRLPEAQRLALPPTKVPQLPAPKIDIGGR